MWTGNAQNEGACCGAQVIRRGDGIGSCVVGYGRRPVGRLAPPTFAIDGVQARWGGGKSRRKSGRPPTLARFLPGTSGVWLSDFLA